MPVVNENDAIADDEIRFGDNDRLAALVAHLVDADLLVLLTDTAGLLTADPRLDASASLIEEIVEVDHELEALAGGAGSVRGSGGMASKIAAAKIAAWSGVRAVIAAADRDGRARRRGRRRARRRHRRAARGSGGCRPASSGSRSRSGRRARSSSTTGARRALEPDGRVAAPGRRRRASRARFDADDAVEVAGPDGEVFAKGLVRHGRRDGLARSPGGAPPTSPRARPTRSSTATTSSSLP